MVQRTLIRPQSSRMGPADGDVREKIMKNSPVYGLYDEAVDRESAYEVLEKRAEQRAKSEAAQSKAKEEPNQKWLYSSGTTNILSKIMRSKFDSYDEYLSFPYDSLFHQINMKSAIIELDNNGNHLLSSYGWANARDWTRFGLLYLNNGNWFGKQIFSEKWVEYSTTPALKSNGKYGAQIWLNTFGEKLPSVPHDAYYENGFGGQRILIIPSKNIVITILSGNQNDFDFDLFYKNVLSCF